MAARSPNVRLRKAFNRREREARYIVSDCDSVEELFKDQHYTKIPEEAATKTILSGLDLDRGSYLGQYTGGAVKQALVDEASINNAVTDNFATLMLLGPKDVCTLENQELARGAARQGIVLLKNSPVIGPNANATIQGS